MGDAQRQIQRGRENHAVFVFLKMCPWEDALKRLLWSRRTALSFVCDSAGNRPSNRGGVKMSPVGICVYLQEEEQLTVIQFENNFLRV